MARQPVSDDSAAWALIPARPSLAKVRAAARSCTACDLYKRATQTVFGEGPAHARIMLVGEQPGDQEDIEGRPFVGPAGRLLDELLEEAGIARNLVYVTNAVKHFKWEPRGKRRLHKKPSYQEIAACKPWLETEVKLVAPRVIVALGATAAQAFCGAAFRLTKSLGQVFDGPSGTRLLATYHPSALLRMPDHDARDEARRLCAQHFALARELAGEAEVTADTR